MRDELDPQQFDRWRAWDQIRGGGLGLKKLIWTVALVGTAIAAAGLGGAEIETWKLVFGESAPETPPQSEIERRRAMEMIAARQNASN
jgi:hypothetical protein